MQTWDTRPRGERRGRRFEMGAACAGVALVALSTSACAAGDGASAPAAADQEEAAPADERGAQAPDEGQADKPPEPKQEEAKGERPAVREEAPKTAAARAKPPRPFGFKGWKLSVEDARGGGARVESVKIESPAAALLRPGDVVVSADQRPVSEAEDLREYMGSVAPGTGVLLRVRRGGGEAYVGVQAGAPAATAPRAPASEPAAEPAPPEPSTPSAATNAPPPLVVALPAALAPPPYGAIPFGTRASAVPYGSYGYFPAPPSREWGSVPPGYYRQAQPGNPLTPWPPSAYIPPEPPPR